MAARCCRVRSVCADAQLEPEVDKFGFWVHVSLILQLWPFFVGSTLPCRNKGFADFGPAVHAANNIFSSLFFDL